MPAKLLVLYPTPTDAAEFERAYTDDHAPMVTAEAIPGIRRFVQTKVVGTADGSAPKFSRVAELYFDSLEDLQKAAAAETAGPVVAHAFEISTGGAPIMLVCETSSKDL